MPYRCRFSVMIKGMVCTFEVSQDLNTDRLSPIDIHIVEIDGMKCGDTMPNHILKIDEEGIHIDCGLGATEDQIRELYSNDKIGQMVISKLNSLPLDKKGHMRTINGDGIEVRLS